MVRVGGLESAQESKPSCEPEKEKDRRVPSPLDQFQIVPWIPMKIGKLYFSFINLYFLLFLGGSYSFFSSLPFVRDMPKEYKIIIFLITRFVFLFILYKQLVYLGYAFMNEQGSGSQPFIPSGSGGLAGGSAPIPGSPGSGGSSGIPNSFSWFYTHESPGQEVTSSREHVGSAEAGPSGRNGTTRDQAVEIEEYNYNYNELSPVERRVKQRLDLYNEDPTRIYSVEDIRSHVEVKGKIVDRMAELDPHPFWTDNRNEIISKCILVKNRRKEALNDGAEYTVQKLKSILNQLRRNPNGKEFKRFNKMREDFENKEPVQSLKGSCATLVQRHRFLLTALALLVVLCTIYLDFEAPLVWFEGRHEYNTSTGNLACSPARC